MRAIWSGSISFGLINIPVRLYSASRERKMQFHYLRSEDACPIQYVKVCKATGEVVPYSNIVRGFEYERGDYVVLSDEEIKQADPRKTQTIEVFQFIKLCDVPKKYFEKPYYLEPTKQARKAYVLLREALKKSGKAGLARFVLRTKEKLAVISAEDNMIILNEIRFQDEIVEPEGLFAPEADIGKRDLDIAIQLIDQLTDVFKPDQYHDEYTEKLEEMIEAKIKGKKVVSREKVPMPTVEMEDIIAKLRKSLHQAKKRNVR